MVRPNLQRTCGSHGKAPQRREGPVIAPQPPYNHTMDAPTSPTTRLGLTTSQAARHLGVSLSTVRRWSDQGHLVGYRTPGGQRRFSIQQLDDFMASLDQAPR